MSDVPARDELPIPDYDHLPVAQLGHRIRALSSEQLQTVLDYEKGHGDRLPVVQVLTTRLQELADGAEPSGGDPAAGLPGDTPPAGTSKVSPSTAGPEQLGPAHGVPTNVVPDQRTP